MVTCFAYSRALRTFKLTCANFCFDFVPSMFSHRPPPCPSIHLLCVLHTHHCPPPATSWPIDDATSGMQPLPAAKCARNAHENGVCCKRKFPFHIAPLQRLTRTSHQRYWPLRRPSKLVVLGGNTRDSRSESEEDSNSTSRRRHCTSGTSCEYPRRRHVLTARPLRPELIPKTWQRMDAATSSSPTSVATSRGPPPGEFRPHPFPRPLSDRTHV
jgi:hypothetical protein